MLRTEGNYFIHKKSVILISFSPPPMASVFVLAQTLAVHILSRCDGHSAQSHLAMYYSNGKHKKCVSKIVSSSDWNAFMSQYVSFLVCVCQFAGKELSVCCRLLGPPVWFLMILKFCGKWPTVAKCLRFGVLLQFLKVLVLTEALRDFTITPTAGKRTS